MSRRDAVQRLASLSFAAVLMIPRSDYDKAWRLADAARDGAGGAPFAPKFFTAAEYRTAGILSDMIIPRDEGSGSATDAGVPEFMDFIMIDRPNNQKWMRDGLAWLNAQSTKRFGKAFAGATEQQREQILNDIAWPARAPAGDVRWRRVLQPVPRSHIVWILVEPHGRQGSALHRQYDESKLERLSPRGAGQARRHVREVRPKEYSPHPSIAR